MAKEKIFEINIQESKGTFSIFKKPGILKKDYDFEGIHALRNLLNNEKARILHAIKNESPESIYKLAKSLGRGFKAVNTDLKLLERFGFVEFIEEKYKNRTRLRPKVIVDSVVIKFNV